VRVVQSLGPGSAVRLAVALMLLFVCSVPQVAAQELPLKTARPAGAVLICESVPATPTGPASAQDRAEAARLTNAATQAMILGDLDGALEFLDRASQVDPTATEGVYLRARILHQQGQRGAAATALCEYLRLQPEGGSAEEVRRRLDDARDDGVARELFATYERALELELEGRLEEADAAFTEVLAARPGAAVAVYNRGVVRTALGRSAEAEADLRRYLELEPRAHDAPQVQRYVGIATGDRIATGQFQLDASTAFVRGALLPGGGQFYTDRPLLGAAITGLTFGALAAGVLYRRTTIVCEDALAARCPADEIISRDTDRPLMAPALGVAVGLALAAAVEAAMHAARRSQVPSAAPSGMPAAARPAGGRVGYDGSALTLELVRLSFGPGAPPR
jgi:tetratricopeptide (TPR) repeat protein